VSTPAEALARLLEVLDRMEVRYQVGGSVASSSHGVPRTTLDIDLVVDLQPEQIEAFVAELKEEFYADPVFIKESFEHGRAANLIHLRTAWKFDLFPLGQDAYSQMAMRRRCFREGCAVATPEDTILRKLEWYRAGGETSERQWGDLLGVCQAVRNGLDTAYLRKWARELGVDDLLENLLTEAAL
jgi:hypothetical protein